MNKKVGLEYLQMKVCQHFLEGRIFLQMDNSFFCQRGSGRLIKTKLNNIVLSFIEKIISKNQLFLFQ
jgi:hypothetical protein